MRKIINFRPFLFAAIGLVVGIYSFYEFLFGDFWFGLVALIIVIAAGVLAAILKTKAWRIAIFLLIFVLVGLGISQLSYFLITKNELLGAEVTVTGRVTDLLRNSTQENKTYYIENCVLSDGSKLSGKIELRLFEDELSIDAGDYITVSGKLYSKYPVTQKVNSNILRDNIRYELQNAKLVKTTDGKANFDESVRKYIYQTVMRYMPQNGDVMYSLLVGDRDPLRKDIEAIFVNAGILHLLAVSGLHVGFVVAVVCFFLKRFKLHPLLECAIVLVPLIFYAYICNFTPSVVRALIMVVCTYLARAVYGRYDILSSLSLAVLCLLLIKPLYLFDVGFQLSVLSVYGIATIYPVLTRWANRRKIHRIFKYLLNSLAVSFSCSVATFFTTVSNFGYFPTMGILINIVAIPLVSVSFVMGLVGLLPFVFHYILWVADKILQLVIIIASFVANLPFAIVEFQTAALCVVAAVIWLFVVGGYVNFKRTGKAIAHSICAIALALCIGLSFVPYKTDSQVYIVYGYDDITCTVMSSNGEATVVGNFTDTYATTLTVQFLGRYRIDKCTLYFTEYARADLALIDKLLKTVDVSKVYTLDFSFNGDADAYFLQKDIPVVQQIKNDTTGHDIKISSVFDAELCGTLITVDGLTVSLVNGNEDKSNRFLSLVDYSDVYILHSANKSYSQQKLTTLSFYQSGYGYNYGANKYGNFTIKQKDGKISINFR